MISFFVHSGAVDHHTNDSTGFFCKLRFVLAADHWGEMWEAGILEEFRIRMHVFVYLQEHFVFITINRTCFFAEFVFLMKIANTSIYLATPYETVLKAASQRTLIG